MTNLEPVLYGLNRHLYPSTEDYAFHIFNGLGCNVSFAYRYPTGAWTKWYPYSLLMEMDKSALIAKNLTLSEFWRIVNNRSVLDIEVLFDCDLSTREENVKLAREISETLTNHFISHEVYDAQSKGLHISVIVPELRDLSPSTRLSFKRAIIQKYSGCDMLKSAERTMISLEGALHFKSCKVKRRVHLDEYFR